MEKEPTSKTPPVRIAIIGTGFAGICMGIQLLRAGIRDFVILERAGDIGGTWRDNTYPGAACDVVSHLYSFSFEPNPNWSRMFAQQSEILEYTRHCVLKYGLTAYIRFNHEVTGGTYDEEHHHWNIHLNDRPDLQANLWINGMGPLNRAVIPDIPGLEAFKGEYFHSSHWQHDCRLEGKKVAVVGTGASAIQIVPNVAKSAGELHVFQRSAAWVIQKSDRPMKEWEKWLFRKMPFTQALYRGFFYWMNELTVIALAKHPKLTGLIRRMALHHMKRSGLPADLQRQLTPDYTIGCKRILPSNEFYPTFRLPHVHLHTERIDRLDDSSVISMDGVRTDVDVLILATGFEAAEFPSQFKIRGRNGVLLSDQWKNGPEAFLGTTVSGFPNMFFIIGPNTGLGHSSMILMIEAQVKYIISCIRELEAQDATAMDVKADIQENFNAEIQSRLADTVWNSGCISWYRTKAGRNTSLWPGHTFEFMRRTKKVTPQHYTFIRP